MQKTVFLFLIVFLCSKGYTQTRLTPGEIKGKHYTFIINKLRQIDTIKYIDVYSKSNKYNSGIPRSEKEKAPHFLHMHDRDIHVNNDNVKQIVLNVLNKKLPALKQNKEQMTIIITLEPDGKLTDVSFTLRENTLVTLEDIEAIDRQLKANIKATFTGNQYKQYIAMDYYPPVIVF